MKKLTQLEERNKRVEADKAWETSKTRRTIIAVTTYIVVVFFLWFIGSPQPYLGALIPVAGFVLSTLSLPYFKRKWLNSVYSRN